MQKKDPVLINCVCKGQITSEDDTFAFNLDVVSMYFSAQESQRKFASCTISLQNPSAAISLFPQGRVVVAGAASFHLSLLALHSFRVELMKLFNTVLVLQDVQVINRVYKLELGHSLDLERMYAENTLCCGYERNNFPGLHLDIPAGSITDVTTDAKCIVYDSGNIIIPGCRELDIVNKICKYLINFVGRY